MQHSQISDAASSLEPRILDIVRSYDVAKVPRVCQTCDGVGFVREKTRRWGTEIFVATSMRLICSECHGRGITWHEPR